jgi:hypothetical protein
MDDHGRTKTQHEDGPEMRVPQFLPSRRLAGLIGLAGLLILAPGPASAAAEGEGAFRNGSPIAPRVVGPRAAALGRPLQSPGGPPRPNAHVQGGVPPSLGGGAPRSGRPPLSSDGSSAAQPRAGGQLPSGAAGPLAATGNFAKLLGFTGATFGNTCTETTEGCFGSEPPDTQMAAGHSEIVEVVNNDLFVFDRSGTQLASYPLTNVFQPPGQSVGVTDPKILYDPTTGKYYMTEMVCEEGGCGAFEWAHMGISLAVSSNPAVGWTVYDYLNDGENLQDQEKLGFSGDKITFAVNEYGCKCGAGKEFKQENIVVIQKSDAVAGNTITPAIYSANSYSSYIFDSMPTTPVNASTSDNTQYVVWDKQATSGNEMAVVRITGTPNEENVDFTGSVTKIGIANQTAPPAPVQPEGMLAGDKQNFQSAMVQGNDLWAVATDGCTPQYPEPDTTMRDCTRLVEVDLASNSVITDTNVGTDGTYRTRPSISKDSDGHIFFGFTISSATQYATAAVDGSALPLPAVLQRINFASGDATYTGGRWGDYSGTQQDPANTHDVWTAQEFGACTTGCSYIFSGNWATALGQFSFREPHITSISPSEGPVTGGTSVDIYGSEFAKEATTVKFGANAASGVTWIDSTHIRATSPPGSVGTVHITASTAAGTSGTSSADEFTYVKVPTTTTYTGPTSGDYHDSFTASATLTNDFSSEGVAGKTITFTLGVGDTCSGTTDGSGEASCTLTPTQTGTQELVASFAGDSSYFPSSDSASFSITPEETALSYTGPTVILAGAGGATLTAKMVEDGSADDDGDGGSSAPDPAESVTLSIGTQTCSATTDPLSGNVSCTIPSVSATLGPTAVGAAFAGDAYYTASSDSTTATVFAFPTNGAFTLGDQTVAETTPTTTVHWWADKWSALNSLSGGTAPKPFKGFVGSVALPNTTPPGSCGGSWTTTPGSSAALPSGVPSYMGTLVTSNVTKSGHLISGNTVGIVVVKTDPGYSLHPRNGTGQIVATFC